jgi:hypothetical protein
VTPISLIEDTVLNPVVLKIDIQIIIRSPDVGVCPIVRFKEPPLIVEFLALVPTIAIVTQSPTVLRRFPYIVTTLYIIYGQTTI